MDSAAMMKTTSANISKPVPDGNEAAEPPPKHVSRIREWIQACNELHGEVCVPKVTSQRPLEDIPSWLIDTHQLCIVTGSSAHRYLALSYVWPEPRVTALSSLEEILGGPRARTPPPRTLLLEGNTISELQAPWSLSSEQFAERIPAVIKYAIELTLELDERYLWVDRLCIIQDNPDVGGTKSQVARMDKIYVGAYLTIIAAAPDEMYYQTITKGWPEFVSSRFPNMNSSPEDKSAVLSDLDIGKVVGKRYRSLARSKWASRGWYQEQILCGRSVALLDDGILWDCQTCVWDAVDLHPGEMPSTSKAHADKRQQILKRWWPDFDLYLDLVCPFNGRQFSYPQDALAAFQGILNALEKSFPGGFLHGLPRLFLDHALLWQPFGEAGRRTDRREDDVIRSSLPSWSWCGWECFVDPWSLRSGLSYIDELDCRKQAGSWTTRNLVQWQVSMGSQSQPVNEPHLLDQCVYVVSNPDIHLPYGWTRLEGSSEKNPRFLYANHDGTFFRHPVPINDKTTTTSSVVSSGSLTCATTTASFQAASYLRRVQGPPLFGALPKTSVFESPIFERGPTEGPCPILILHAPNGAFAGLLRLPTCRLPGWKFYDRWNYERVTPIGSDISTVKSIRVPSWSPHDQTVPIELIAISTGSASASDMRASMEWRVFETGRDTYKQNNHVNQVDYELAWINDDGKPALLSDITTAFRNRAVREENSMVQRLSRSIDDQVTKQLFEESLEVSNNCLWDELLWFETRNAVLRGQAELLSRKELRFQDPDENASYRRSRNDPRQEYLQQSVLERTLRNGSLQNLLHESSKGEQSADIGDTICEFYNVLWVERKDGIAYRRACGWVPKHVWEAYATGPEEIRLG